MVKDILVVLMQQASCGHSESHGLAEYTADCTTVVILLGNRRWPCGLGMNREFT